MDSNFTGNSKKGTVTWITPKKIIDALGPFDLDPCAHTRMPWATAERMLTIREDGLKTFWPSFERVWLNPPYTTETMKDWLGKMQQHGNGIGITFASTDVKWFKYIWKADARLFIEGRVKFYDEFGNIPLNDKGQEQGPGKGSVLAAWGRENVIKLKEANAAGIIEGEFQFNNSYKLIL